MALIGGSTKHLSYAETFERSLMTLPSKSNRWMTKRMKVKWWWLGGPTTTEKINTGVREAEAKHFLVHVRTQPRHLGWCRAVVQTAYDTFTKRNKNCKCLSVPLPTFSGRFPEERIKAMLNKPHMCNRNTWAFQFQKQELSLMFTIRKAVVGSLCWW